MVSRCIKASSWRIHYVKLDISEISSQNLLPSAKSKEFTRFKCLIKLTFFYALMKKVLKFYDMSCLYQKFHIYFVYAPRIWESNFPHSWSCLVKRACYVNWLIFSLKVFWCSLTFNTNIAAYIDNLPWKTGKIYVSVPQRKIVWC